MPLSSPSTAIVIGSGIVGAATTYFLTQRGVKVTLLDAMVPAAGATGAADGAVSVASKRPGPMMTAALSGIELYRELALGGLFSDLFKLRSTFIVAASEAETEVLDAHATALASAGVRVERLDRTTVRQRFSPLSENVRFAVEVHEEGHAIGYQIVHRLLAASGVVVKRANPVKAILRRSGQQAGGVLTADGEIRADAVIVTAGSGSAALAGLQEVLIPRKGQLLVTERARALNAAMPGSIMSGRYLLSKGSQKGQAAPPRGLALVIDPLRTGQFLIGGTREDHGDRHTNDLDAVTRILRDAVALMPDLGNVRLLRSFAGVRTAVVDGLPLVGRISGYDNAYIATGFEGDGICLGPIMGKAVANLVCGEAAGLNLAPFDPCRFVTREVAA